MCSPSKSPLSQGFTPLIRAIATGVYLATSLLFLCNTLRASDLAGESINTYVKMDSLFRTHYDPLVSPGKGTGWKPFNRMEWFYGQRAFPSGNIPVEARKIAWEEKRSSRDRRTLDENWTAMGPNNIAGRILSIAWHPTNTNIIYVGSASGGVWKTTDGGSSWNPLTDDLPSLAVGSVVLDPSNPDIVYIGTGEGSYNIDAVYGAGILKSTDAGATWNTTGMSWSQSQSRAINKIIIHPTNSQIQWCATNIWSGGGGVYKTVNGGSSWTRYLNGDAKDIVIHPDSADVLYAAIGYPFGGSSNGVYKSTDGGATWTLRSTGLPSGTSMGRMALSISRSNPQTVFVGISQTVSGGAGLLGIYRTTDAGANWTLQANTPSMYGGQGWYNIVCEVHPTNPSIVYSCGLDLYKSSNAGVNWSQKSYWNYTPGHSLYAHADHHALAFKPGDPNTIIAGTDGGLYKSTNGGDTWVGINNGLSTFQFYAMCNDYLNANVAYGGTQDNGTDKYNNSTSWSAVLGGDGAYCNVDFTNSNIVYAGTQRGAHYRSTNGGGSFVSIQSGISGSGAWVTPRVMDPTNSTTLYTGTTMVYKTTNSGTNWTAISSALSSQYISTIAVAPSNPQVIYIGYENNGQVYKTTNGGASWTACYTGLPYRYITRVAVHPTDPNTVYVTVSGYGTGHIWKSTDGGTNWANSGSGVPDIPCNVIVINSNDPNKLYVGTDLGVYASTNGGTSWVDYSSGLPNVVVDDLALHPTTGMLRAATHGRGMWQTATSTPSVTVLTPNGGESWITGSSQTITWGTGGLGGNMKIELNRSYPSGGWETLIASTANDGSWSWTVSGATTSSARVRIASVETPSATDVSNSDFSITQPQITVTAPNGGQTWTVGTSQTIAWTLSGATGNVVVQLDRSYPSGSWETITTTSSASYAWTVTVPATATARARVYLQSNSSVCDTSDANFTIVEPSVTVTYPNGGESLTPGSVAVLRWARHYLTGSVKVELNRTYPSGSWVTLASSISVDTLQWTVDQNSTTTARIRVTSNSYTAATDVSDGNFTVLTPSLTVTYPNGGELWSAGNPYVIRWTKSNLSGPVNIYINRDYPGGTWSALAVSVTADTFAWNAVTPFSNAARIRVSAVTIAGFSDESNADFVIGTGIVLASPNGAESWPVGSAQTISWSRYNAAGAATVQVNRSYPGGTWETLSSSVTTNSLAWTVTGPGASAVRVRVFLNATPSIGDTSDGNFSIPAPGLTLTAPTGGEQWGVGSSQTISWTRIEATGNVTVQLNRAYPGGTWETLTSTASGSSISWTATSQTSTTARIRIYLTATPTVGDSSDQNFAIGTSQLTLSAPNGGETWAAGFPQTIRWTRQFAAGEVRIMLNRNYPGGSWETIASAVAADTFSWTATSPAATAARIRVYLVSTPSAADTSAANFTIAIPAITVTTPNGGEQWVIGQAQTISFTRSNADGEATVQFNRAYPSGTWETVTASAAGTSVVWTPSGYLSSTCRVRVFLNAVPSARDSSNANFSLVGASLTVTSPNGGETWSLGKPETITWSRSNADGAVTVALNRTYPSGTWQTLSSSETGNSMTWTVSGATASVARVRVTLNGNPSLTDESNANFSIVQPALTLSAPNGGETYTMGGLVVVRWSRTAASGPVTILLNRNYSAGAWETLANDVTADTFAWTAGGAASGACRIKIRLNSDTTLNDVSASNFTLVSRALVLTSHNGGETVYTGSSSTISFTRTNATGNATIQLNRSYPAGSWETLSSTVSASSYSWNVSGTAGSTARLRIFLNSDAFVGDTSNANFTIAAPSLLLLSPNGGEQWVSGTQRTILWQRSGVTENVRVDLKRNYPSGSWETIASSVSASAYVWTVSGTGSSNARIRVVSTTNPAIADTCDANFSIINSPLTLTTPNGGDVFNIGFPNVIRWTRVSAPGEARVELNRNWPTGTWELLGATTADSLVWTADGSATTNARVKIYLTATPATGDTSAANFTIQQPELVLTSPAGGARWAVGNGYSIAWTRIGLTGSVRVELNTDYPAGSWRVLASGQSGGSYFWTIDEPQTEHARIRITDEAYPAYADTSGDFSIVEPGVIVLAPNGGDTLIVGQSSVLRWQRAGISGAVKVELNRNYPTGAWETLHSGTNADSLNWTAAGADAARARIRVSSVVSPSLTDESDGDFMIAHQGILLLSPVAGDSVTLGMPVEIRWHNIGVAPGVYVYLKRNWPSGSWEMLGANITAESLTWTAAGNASETARFRVLSAIIPSLGDTTDGAVRIGAPQFTFTQPAAADTFYAGETVRLKWTRRFAAGAVRVELSRSGTSGPWEEIGIAEGDSIDWNVAGPATNTMRLRVSLVSASWASGVTAYHCTIHVPSLSVTLPTAGNSYPLGRDMTIAWTRQQCPWPVDVFLQRSDGMPVELLRSSAAGDTIHWTASGQAAAASRIIVRTSSGVSVEASSGYFTLANPRISLLAPQGGEIWVAGQTAAIRWQRMLVNDAVRVELNRDYPSGAWTTLTSSTADTFLLWNIAGPNTTHARVRIVSTADAALADTCGSDLEIRVPELVLGDLGRSSVIIGFPIELTWTRTAVEGAVAVYLSRDNGATWPSAIATGITGDRYEWIPSGATAEQARVKVQSADQPHVSSISDFFALVQPQFSVTTPAGGETFALGSSIAVRWAQTDHPATVKVQLDRSYPSGVWETIAVHVNADSFAWNAAGAESGAARFRVMSEVDSAWRAESGTFALRAAAVNITAPIHRQEIITGEPFTITWERTVFTSPVQVLLRTVSGNTLTLGSGVMGNSLADVVVETEADSSWIVVEAQSGFVPRDSVRVIGPIKPSVTITSPHDGVRWVANRSYEIHVDRYYAAGALTVQTNSAYPDSAWHVMGTMNGEDFSIAARAISTGTFAVAVTLDSRPQVSDTVFNIRVLRPTVSFIVAQSACRITDVLNVAWDTEDVDSSVRLELDRNYPSGTWELLYEGMTGEYAWTVTGDTTSHARLRLTCPAYPEAADTLDSDLVFYRPELYFTNGFESEYHVGGSLPVQWTALWSSGPFNLILKRNEAVPETLLANSVDTSFDWVAALPRADAATLIVQDVNSGLADTSGAFAIRLTELHLISPVESGTDTAGAMLELAWEWTDGEGAVRIEAVRDSLGGEWETIADSVAETHFSYVVSGPETDSLRLRISSLANPGIFAISAPRSVVVPLLALSVEGGTTWYIGEQHWIYWTRAHYDGPVTVELTSGDRADPWEEVASEVVVDSFLWTVTGEPADLVALRVLATARPGLFDTTDVPLRIALPRVEVVAPNGGEVLEVDQEIRLRWIGEGFGGGVGIGLWRGDPVNRFDTLFTDTPNDSAEIWQISGPAAHDCYLIVVSLSNPELYDTSETRFEITGGSSATEPDFGLPREYSLKSPYPNPFNSATTIEFALPRDGRVMLAVYDVLGREVERLVDEPRRAGVHRVNWRADRAATGVYFARLTSGDYQAVRRLHLIK